MATDKNAFKAGLFIVAAVVLAGAFMVALQGSRGFFEPTRTVTAVFDLRENLGGLKAGDPVRVGGFDQGRVKSIRYAPAGDNAAPPHMEVRFTLPEKYDLRQDAVLIVEQGLTGVANLNVTDFGRAMPWRDGTPLDGRPSAIGTFYDLAPEFKALVADVRSRVGPTYDRYEKTMASADDAVVRAKAAMTAFRDFLGGSGPDLRGTLANLNKATARLPGSLDKADGLIDDARKTVADIDAAVADARPTVAVAKETMAAARAAIQDAHGVLIRNRARIDNTLASVRQASANFEGATAEIQRAPWRLLYQPGRDEVANTTLYDATRQFARAANQLNDAAGAVRDAAADPDVNKQDLQALLNDLQQTFGKYREVERVLWQSVK